MRDIFGWQFCSKSLKKQDDHEEEKKIEKGCYVDIENDGDYAILFIMDFEENNMHNVNSY